MNYTDLLKSLKGGIASDKIPPIIVAQGEETHYIDLITDYVEDKLLDDSAKSFNLTVLYGKDIDKKTVVDNAMRYPVMAARQIVIVKEAQQMKDIAELADYFERPAPTTLLLLCYRNGSVDKRTKLAKVMLAPNVVVMDSPKLYENQIPDWISRYLTEKKLTIPTQEAALIAAYLGNDLGKVSNELDKLALNLPAGSTVTTEAIQANIGISKEFNVFELQSAIGQRNALRVFQIVNYFAANPRDNPLVKTLASLFGYFSKVYIATSKLNASDDDLARALGMRFPKFAAEYKVAARNFPRPKTERVLHLLRDYDLKSKGVNRDNTTEGELLKELMIHILHS